MWAFKTLKISLALLRREYLLKCLDRISTAGFTLLEVLVCLSIISIVLVAVYRTHSQTLIMNRSTQFYTTAPLLAQRQLSEIELNTPANLTDDSGDYGNEYPGYQWKISVSDNELSEPDTVSEDMKRIDITVAFNQDELIYNLRSYRYLPQ